MERERRILRARIRVSGSLKTDEEKRLAWIERELQNAADFQAPVPDPVPRARARAPADEEEEEVSSSGEFDLLEEDPSENSNSGSSGLSDLALEDDAPMDEEEEPPYPDKRANAAKAEEFVDVLKYEDISAVVVEDTAKSCSAVVPSDKLTIDESTVKRDLPRKVIEKLFHESPSPGVPPDSGTQPKPRAEAKSRKEAKPRVEEEPRAETKSRKEAKPRVEEEPRAEAKSRKEAKSRAPARNPEPKRGSEDDRPDYDPSVPITVSPTASGAGPNRLNGPRQVVVTMVNGLVRNGTLKSPDPTAREVQLQTPEGDTPPVRIDIEQIRSIRLLLPTGTAKPDVAGRRVRVVFADGYSIEGVTTDHRPECVAFTVFPRSERFTERHFAFSHAVKQVEFLD